MSKPKLKVSELIKNTCCGTLLEVPKHKLVEMAEKLESDNERFKEELTKENNRKKRMFPFVAFLILWFLYDVVFMIKVLING